MTHDEAKAILRATPRGPARVEDPSLLEALHLLESDAELRRWYAQESAFDASIRERLNEIPAPADLRSRILATRPINRSRQRWLISALAMAAALIPIAGLIYLVLPSVRARSLPTELGEFVLHDAVHGAHHPGGALVRSIQSALGNLDRTLLQGLPASLGDLRADGCRMFEVAGHEVAEICFSRDGVDMHLYVMDAHRIKAVPPTFLEKEGHTSVTWSDGQFLYSLFGDKPRPAVARLL